jgi:hypothetical protein
MRGNHTWNENDEVVGLYLYRFGHKGLPYPKEELAKDMGMTWGSMGRKIANFRHLDGKGGLAQYSRQCEKIYLRYKEVPDAEFEVIGLEAIVKVAGENYQRLQSLSAQKRMLEPPAA